MLLTDKRILVTGGARRIGEAIVLGLEARGAEAVVHCNRADCGEKPAVRMDFMTGDPEELIARCGPLDGIVNNASVFLGAPPAEQFRVNCEFPIALARAFFRTGRPGAVVNILDSSVREPSGDPYRQSKFLLREATKALAAEFAPRMRVNGVALGPALPPEELAHLKMRKTLQIIPLRRKVALGDIVSAVAFMFENGSVTGAILDVDCGMGMIV